MKQLLSDFLSRDMYNSSSSKYSSRSVNLEYYSTVSQSFDGILDLRFEIISSIVKLNQNVAELLRKKMEKTWRSVFDANIWTPFKNSLM